MAAGADDTRDGRELGMSQLPGLLRSQHARERWDSDYYVEPAWCVHLLFDTVHFYGSIHDPCCGGGTIPTVARERWLEATGSDLRKRRFGESGIDFFTDNRPRRNIVSNPPYKLLEQFIHHALAVAERKVAVVVRLPFLAGQNRLKTLYGVHHPRTVIVLSRRPSMPPGDTDIPARNGTDDYCWCVWQHGFEGPTELRWAA